MNIIVTVKQVPDTHEVKIDPKTGALIREGVSSIINPEDKNAIEEALRLKKSSDDGEVTVLSMGPLQAESTLREALSMGVDRAILVSDRAFAGADTLATSYTLSMAIKKNRKIRPDPLWKSDHRWRDRTSGSTACRMAGSATGHPC